MISLTLSTCTFNFRLSGDANAFTFSRLRRTPLLRLKDTSSMQNFEPNCTHEHTTGHHKLSSQSTNTALRSQQPRP